MYNLTYAVFWENQNVSRCICFENTLIRSCSYVGCIYYFLKNQKKRKIWVFLTFCGSMLKSLLCPVSTVLQTSIASGAYSSVIEPSLFCEGRLIEKHQITSDKNVKGMYSCCTTWNFSNVSSRSRAGSSQSHYLFTSSLPSKLSICA